MLYTTYSLAVKHNACERALDAWREHAGKKLDKDAPIPLTDVLDVLGLQDCLWALRTVEDQGAAKTIAVKFATACADRVLVIYENRHPNDKRPRKAIEAAQAYLLNPSKETAYAAYAAAYAAYAAAYAANAAAYAAYAAAYAANAAAYAADAAAYAAEKKWQTAKLKELLEVEHAAI